MTEGVIRYLRNNGLHVEVRDRDQSKLKAYRRNLVFPGLLHELKLSGHRDVPVVANLAGLWVSAAEIGH